MKMYRADKCEYCQNMPLVDSEGGQMEGVIYTKARALWLEHAAEQLADAGGDDEWSDWIKEGERLSEKGE